MELLLVGSLTLDARLYFLSGTQFNVHCMSGTKSFLQVSKQIKLVIHMGSIETLTDFQFVWAT